MTEKAAYELGKGIAWMGFWIGLGLYNLQGCHPDLKDTRSVVEEIRK